MEPAPRAPRFVLVDRDGVLNRDRPESVLHRSQLEILPGVPRAIRILNEAGYRVIVVTNQGCVGRGELSPSMLEAIHEELRLAVGRDGGRLERIYVCQHRSEDACQCRKPLPGLLLKAIQEYHLVPESTWVVGDGMRDIQAAEAAGCVPALVLSGKTTGATAPKGVATFSNLLEFAMHVVSARLSGSEAALISERGVK